jgi:hypothetical protein
MMFETLFDLVDIPLVSSPPSLKKLVLQGPGDESKCRYLLGNPSPPEDLGWVSPPDGKFLCMSGR